MERSLFSFFRRGYAWAISALLLLGLTACQWDGNQSALDPKGPVAQQQYDTFLVTLYVTLFLFVTVGGALLWVVIRYRAKPGSTDEALPSQSHGNPMIELGLILFSAVMLVIVAVPTVQGIVFMKRVPAELEEGSITVNVTGYQWWWSFEYPELGITTANELWIPAGKAVKLNLIADDVIHSFWVPKLAGKTDLIPGQINTMWIKADEPGYFWGQCAEFCGDSHAYMLFRTIAATEEDFNAWVAKYQTGPELDPYDPNLDENPIMAENPDAPLIKKGIALYNQHCSFCHKIGAIGGEVGPDLSHLASRTTIAAGWMENTPENLHEWILDPDSIKPGNLMWYGTKNMTPLKDANLTSEDVDAIVAFMLTLK